jgi:hypothetical protein
MFERADGLIQSGAVNIRTDRLRMLPSLKALVLSDQLDPQPFEPGAYES